MTKQLDLQDVTPCAATEKNGHYRRRRKKSVFSWQNDDWQISKCLKMLLICLSGEETENNLLNQCSGHKVAQRGSFSGLWCYFLFGKRRSFMICIKAPVPSISGKKPSMSVINQLPLVMMVLVFHCNTKR